MGSQDRPDRFLCPWEGCGKSYGKASKLNEHLRSHTNTRPYVCDVGDCAKSFLRNGHLQRHKSTAHRTGTERPFHCQQMGCTKSFTLKHHLHRHMRLHEEPRPFRCEEAQCEERFARKGQLRKHLLSHHQHLMMSRVKEAKIYLCGVDGCTERFDKWSLAVAHRKATHRPSIRHECALCQRCFTRKATLMEHIRRKHERLGPGITRSKHQCPHGECREKSFCSRYSLKVHIATVHDKIKPYKCLICEMAFGHKHLLQRHRRTHERGGEAGEKRETAPSESDQASIAQFESPIMAPLHDSRLMEMLTGAEYASRRPFECIVVQCRKRFLREYDLDRHYESCHPQIALSLTTPSKETIPA